MATKSNGWTITHNIDQATGQYTTYTLTCKDQSDGAWNFNKQEKKVTLQCAGQVMTGDVIIDVKAKDGSGTTTQSLTRDDIEPNSIYQVNPASGSSYVRIKIIPVFNNITLTSFTKGWFETNSMTSGTITATLSAKVDKMKINIGDYYSIIFGKLATQYSEINAKDFINSARYVLMSPGYHLKPNDTAKDGEYIKVNGIKANEVEVAARIGSSYNMFYPSDYDVDAFSAVKVQQIDIKDNFSHYSNNRTSGEYTLQRGEIAVICNDDVTLWYGDDLTKLSNDINGGAVIFNNGTGWYVMDWDSNPTTQLKSGKWNTLKIKTSSNKYYRIMTPHLESDYD